MIPKTIIVPVICLVAGVIVGRLLPRENQEKQVAESASQPASARKAHTSAADAPQEISPSRPLKKTRSESASENVEHDERILVPASLLRDLSRTGGTRSPGQPLFVADDSVCKALRITDPEKAAIQTAWNDSLRSIRELEAKSVKSTMTDEWTVRLTVPDLSSSMVALGEDFGSKVRTLLGDDRSGVLLAAKQVDALFEAPAGERSVTVSTEEIGNGSWRYRMTLEGSEGNRVWVGESIPDEIRHLAEASGMVPGLKP